MTDSMLPKRLFGFGGPEITTVGFGAWAVGGGGPGGLGKVDDAESVAAIRRAVELGVNWIDTAPAYGQGHSEEVVGRAVAPYDAGVDVFVFTKCGIATDGFALDLSAESVRRDCEASLRRLGIERLDAVQIHWPGTLPGPVLEESWGALAGLVDEGKVRWIGASNFDVDLLERCNAIRHVDLVQVPFSLLRRGARNDLVPWCRENGTTFLSYSPLATGLLTGTYDRARLAALPDDDSRARIWPDFSEPRLSAALALIEELRPIAERLGTTLTALSIAWVLAVPGVTGAIVGGRRPDQVSDWIPAANLALDIGVLSEIDRAIAAAGAGDDARTPTGF